MFKLRITQKGLLLVAVPLLFGTAFISFLYVRLSEANLMTQRELMLQDAIISQIIATHRLGIGQYALTNQDNALEKELMSCNELSDSTYRHLRVLLKNEKSIKVPPVEQGLQQLIFGSPSNYTSPFLKQLQSMSDRQNIRAADATKVLDLTLWGGISAGILMSLGLAIFFCLNITNRLLLIVNNTRNIATGAPLSSPLKGSDEIAELDQLLFESATKIRELEQFKKEMIGKLTRDLELPLAAISSFLVSLESAELGDRAKTWVKRTHVNVQRLTNLVSELLSLDRLELTMKPAQISIDELLASSVDTVKELSEQFGVRVETASGGGFVYADRERLLQVIVNLLSNALKFSPNNGKIILEGKLQDGWFECRVVDQGRGIPEEFRQKIFEPFKQVDPKDATSKKGTGLGLTISKSIVEQHGGTIGVDSKEGSGSTFWFRIPLKEISTQSPDKEPSLNNIALLNQDRAASKPRKFSVLQQGLFLIAVPLVFQIGFAIAIGNMLQQVKEQTRKEEKSKQILDVFNKLSEEALSGFKYGLFNVYAPNPTLENAAKLHYAEVRKLLLQATDLSTDRKQIDQIKKIARIKNKMIALLNAESKNTEHQEAFINMRWTEAEVAALRSVLPEFPSSMVDQFLSEHSIVLQPADSFNETNPFFAINTDSLHMRLLPLILSVETLLEKQMARAKSEAETLSIEHTRMIESLKTALCAGIIFNSLVSCLLAIFVLRNLVFRLQHVMANTTRLVNRAPLDPPIQGGDELSYLDQVLYETGMRLHELEEFKKKLIGIVSHELRTPLMSISVGLELFKNGIFGELSENGKSQLQFTQAETERLIRMVNDVLDKQKFEAGELLPEVTLRKIYLDQVIENAMEKVEGIAEKQGIEIDATGTRATVQADFEALSQVLIELMSRAVTFAKPGSSIKLDGRVADKEIELSVSFFAQQAYSNIDASKEGELAYCQNVIKMHNGTMYERRESAQQALAYCLKLPLTEGQA